MTIMTETTPGSAVDMSRVERVRADFLNPLKMRGFFLAKLPLALFAGLRVRSLTADRCEVSVPRGWRTTNPFKSTYFAAQSMAAELSTGALAMLATQGTRESVALLITDLRATFEKKASADAVFTCDDGPKAFAAVAETLRTGEGVVAEMETVGRMADGTVVSRFVFTWSFKKRSS
jgi:hypothetical protein